MDLGDPIRVVEVEPADDPVPAAAPEPVEQPERVEEPEKVGWSR